MRREESPQRLGREGWPLVATAVDGDEHGAPVVGASGRGRGDGTTGRRGRNAALIYVAPERVDFRHRRTVDDAEALPAAVGDEPIGGAVDVDDRRRTRCPAR